MIFHKFVTVLLQRITLNSDNFITLNEMFHHSVNVNPTKPYNCEGQTEDYVAHGHALVHFPLTGQIPSLCTKTKEYFHSL